MAINSAKGHSSPEKLEHIKGPAFYQNHTYIDGNVCISATSVSGVGSSFGWLCPSRPRSEESEVGIGEICGDLIRLARRVPI